MKYWASSRTISSNYIKRSEIVELKNLNAHNAEMHKRYHEASVYPRLNGIACPECGAELWDSDAMILMSNPPQKNVHCNCCSYIGYRVC